MITLPDFTLAETLLADDTGLLVRGTLKGQPVLLRTPRDDYPPPDELARLKYGHEISASLEGAGTVRSLALLKHGSSAVVVMEDFGGVPLQRVQAQANASLKVALEIGIRLAKVLGELHLRRIIHKNIHPSAILLHPRTWEVRLSHFDIASRLGSESLGILPPEKLEGNLAYISPEQTGRMNRSVDYRTDLYSLGVTLYELLTGQLPFPATDMMALVYSHLAVEPVPPHQVRPTIPQPLSAVVMKLLAKNAEERYQSAYGLSVDLKQCLEQLEASGTIADFRPGGQDVSATFRIPQKLYGREQEGAQLGAAFERISEEGRSELLLVTGYSGVGKSSLVNEIHLPLVRQRGYYGAGKYNQYQNAPYAAWVQAFDGLCRQLLAESEEQLAQWRRRLQAALGANGRVVTDLVPQLELIIGPQPPVPVLGLTETHNRFNLMFQQLVAVCARQEHPLVLFLDDLQWADAASLELLQRVLLNPSIRHLLVLGAYRDNEIRAGHGLLSTLEEVRKQAAALTEISLRPLDLTSVHLLLADTMQRARDAEVDALAQLVFQKTQGNPFFLNQFVRSLNARGLLSFDPERGRWRWDLERIQREAITDNVANFMAEQLGSLPVPTQEVLKRAACIGNTFSLGLIAAISEQSPRQATEQLWDAVQAGLLLPLGNAYKYLPGEASQSASEASADVQYEFLHDRVQEAAYALMSEETRNRLHLRVGRLLLEELSEEQREASIFDIVNQLNQALELIDAPAERERLARLNLRAGLRAKASSAYKEALGYLQIGISLLDEAPWERQYELVLPLHRHRAECLYKVARYDEAEFGFDTIIERSHSLEEKTEMYILLMELYVSQGKYFEAIVPARRGFAMLGIPLPEGLEATAAAVARERALLEENLRDRSIASLAELPEAADPVERARILYISRALGHAAYVHPDLFQLLTMMAVNRAVQYGHGPGSGTNYSLYAISLLGTEDYARTFEFGELSLILGDRFDPLNERPLTLYDFATFLSPWLKPISTSLPFLEQAFQASVARSMFWYATISSMQLGISAQLGGEELGVQLARMQWHLDFYRRGGAQFHQSLCEVGAPTHSILRLIHGTIPAGSLQYLEEDYLLKNLPNPTIAAGFAVLLVRVAYLLELPEQRAALARAEAQVSIIHGWAARAEMTLYQGLLLARLHASASESERPQMERTLTANLESLQRLSTLCPENFLQKYRMLAAEWARLAGQDAQAMALYDAAIEAAAAHGITHEEALANELAARFYLERGRRKVARTYLEDARARYSRWGARAKVEQLERQYPELLRPHSQASGQASTSLEGLDLGAVLKASQAISGEIVLSALHQKLMAVILENAGAQRGVLLLKGDSPLTVEARQHKGTGVEVRVHEPAQPLAELLPEVLVRYVERTRERVVLHEARESPFQADEYIARQRPRAALCIPILKQARLVGTLYLENHLVAGAFTPERCKVLDLLSAQVAISLENARLYDTLDQRVRERTQELRASNEELAQTLQQLRKAQSQLVMKEKLASLGVLTSGIAHEIRNPLNFITNFALHSLDLADELTELATSQRERMDPMDAQQLDDIVTSLRESVGKIDEHGKRADSIVRSMLELSRSRSSGEQVQVPLNELVREYVRLAYTGLQSQYPSLQVSLQTQFDESLQPVEVMPQEFGRVIINLLNNACYAADERGRIEGGGFTPVVHVSTRELGEGVEIRVRDNGMGIMARLRKNIFTPFFTTKPAGQGTGLGLSISHEIIVQGHGGRLEFDSEEGQYTEFCVTLPRQPRGSCSQGN
jgi:predicted ATPase/signal transduction histidine kinase